MEIVCQTFCQNLSYGTPLTFICHERHGKELMKSPLRRLELRDGKICRILVKQLPCIGEDEAVASCSVRELVSLATTWRN